MCRTSFTGTLLGVLWLAGSSLLNPVHALTPAPDQILAGAATGQPTARFFGQSMAVQGTRLAIGASGSSAQAAPGSVWIFERVGVRYTLAQVLQAPTPVNGDGFGQIVQFNGDQLLVGAPLVTAGGVNQRGIVYAYALQPSGFVLAQSLNPGTAVGTAGLFGFHLSADGDWLAVGAPLNGVNQVGEVQLFRLDAQASWVHHSTISAAVAAVNGRLGLRVLLRGERLLAAAPQEPVNNFTGGYVYEYQRSGSGAAATWTQVQRLRPATAPIPESTQTFGAGLALSPNGTRLMVGAPFDLEAAADQRGAVFAFQRGAGGQWAEVQRIASPAGGRAENFGSAITFASDTQVLVGDIRETDTGFTTELGGVHELVFSPALGGGITWLPRRQWVRGSGFINDFFGNAIAADGDTVLIGSAGHNEPPDADVGRVYSYYALFKDGFE